MNPYDDWVAQNQPWGEPSPLPSPSPTPSNVFTNQYPSNWGNAPSGNIPPPAGIFDLVPPGGSLQQLLQGLGYHGPTDRIAGFLGGLIGGPTTQALIPVPGSGILGGKLGSWGARSFVNWLSGIFGPKWPGITPPAKTPSSSGGGGTPSGGGSTTTPPSGGSPSGGGSLSDLFPGDWGGLGKPMGYFDIPNFMGIGDFGAPSTMFGAPSGQGTIANIGITLNDILASGVTPRSVQSVGAPSGGFAPMGFSGPSNIDLLFLRGGEGTGDRPHINPLWYKSRYGGIDKPAGTPVAVR